MRTRATRFVRWVKSESISSHCIPVSASGSKLFSDTELESLLAYKPVASRPPWSDCDEQAVEKFYRRLCTQLERQFGLKSRIEWDHYGSGYASFVDAWFYKEHPEFAVASAAGYASEHTGLVVLLSRHVPLFALSQADKGWASDRGYAYMPSLDMIDVFKSAVVHDLAEKVQVALEAQGLQRAWAPQLALQLPAHLHLQSNLSGSSLTHFDALFHWDD